MKQMNEAQDKKNKSSSRCAVFAYSEVGYLCLAEMIEQGADIVAVFTHPDDPDENIWFHSVADLAREHGIATRVVSKMSDDDVLWLEGLEPDLIFSFYFRAMIPSRALSAARRGAFNMHGALLPKYRGRACVNWAVINGETETGTTLHVMTERADAGDIIAQRSVPIAYEETAHDIFLKVAEASRQVIADVFDDIAAGRETRTPQDESKATKFGRRRPSDGEIDWTKSATEIYNLIRGVTHPFPGAFAEIDGVKTFIWKAAVRDGSAAPGEVISRRPFIIGTGEGAIEILRFQREGEEEMDA